MTISKFRSGNQEIDDFLQSTDDVLQWFPYIQFENIKEIGRGGFATIYYAEWKNEMYESEIVLKEFHDSEKISAKFLNEINALHKCMKKGGVLMDFLGCYGMSQNPLTKNYIIVMQYFERCSLNRNLNDVVRKKWHEKLKMLSQIAMDLKTIHEVNLIHKDFHSGNILQDEHFNSYISDMGLSEPPNVKNNNDGIYGVLPYMAPEVLCGHSYTKASDIYSFGIIMWEFTSGKPPFANHAHDFNLQFGIITGLRPTIIRGTPQCFIDLMKNCWDKNPDNRPTAEEIYNTLEKWLNEYEIQQQFSKSDEMPVTNSTNMFYSFEIHPDAIYTSRLIYNSYNNFMLSKHIFRFITPEYEDSKIINLGMSRLVSAYLKSPTEKIVSLEYNDNANINEELFVKKDDKNILIHDNSSSNSQHRLNSDFKQDKFFYLFNYCKLEIISNAICNKRNKIGSLINRVPVGFMNLYRDARIVALNIGLIFNKVLQLKDCKMILVLNIT